MWKPPMDVDVKNHELTTIIKSTEYERNCMQFYPIQIHLLLRI